MTQIGKALALPTDRYPVPGEPDRLQRQPKPLDLAVAAIQAQEALEVLAGRQVALAREHDQVTWEQVGAAFDITAQSAHHRFAKRV